MVLARSLAEGIDDGGFDEDTYIGHLDRLPLPGPTEIERALLDVAADSVVLRIDDLMAGAAERLGFDHDDPVVGHLIEHVEQDLTDELGPLAWLAGDRTAHVAALCDGIVLTHVLNESERAIGALTVSFDLAGSAGSRSRPARRRRSSGSLRSAGTWPGAAPPGGSTVSRSAPLWPCGRPRRRRRHPTAARAAPGTETTLLDLLDEHDPYVIASGPATSTGRQNYEPGKQTARGVRDRRDHRRPRRPRRPPRRRLRDRHPRAMVDRAPRAQRRPVGDPRPVPTRRQPAHHHHQQRRARRPHPAAPPRRARGHDRLRHPHTGRRRRPRPNPSSRPPWRLILRHWHSSSSREQRPGRMPCSLDVSHRLDGGPPSRRRWVGPPGVRPGPSANAGGVTSMRASALRSTRPTVTRGVDHRSCSSNQPARQLLRGFGHVFWVPPRDRPRGEVGGPVQLPWPRSISGCRPAHTRPCLHRQKPDDVLGDLCAIRHRWR